MQSCTRVGPVARRWLLALRALALAWALIGGLDAAAAQPTLPSQPIERYRLANGLEVLLQRDTRQPRVAVVLAYDVGERDEPDGYAGIAHVVEHLSFRGSRHLAPLAAMSELERAGASEVNAGTGKDGSYYYALLPSSQLERALWVESDRMAFLLEKLDARSLALEKSVVVGELLQRRSPQRLFEMHLDRLLYPEGHPYVASLEEEQDVAALELPQVQWFFQRTYRPDNAAVVIVGDIDVAKTKQQVNRYFGPIANPPGKPLRRSAVRRAAQSVELSGSRQVVIDLPYDRQRMAVVYPAPPGTAPDAMATQLLAALLGDGRLSRLWRAAVERSGLAKHIEASVERRQLGSWLRFDAELAYQAAHTKLLGIIDREIQLLLTGPLSAEELEEVKMGAIADVVSAHEQLMLRGLALALSARDDSIPLYDPNRQIRQIRAVDVAALRRVAAKLLRADRRLVATMRTNSDAPAQGEVSATSGRLFR